MNSPALFAVEVDSQTNKDVSVGFVTYPSIENIHSRWSNLQRDCNGSTWQSWSGSDRKNFVKRVQAKGNRIEIRFGAAPFSK
jgi:hypothetical protein